MSDECTAWWNNCSCQKCLRINLLSAAILLMPKLAAIICSRNLIRKLLILCGLATLLILKPKEYGTICVLLWIYSHERWFRGIYPQKPMLNWLLQLLKRHMKNEILRMDLCFIPTEVRSILPSHSGSFSILLILCSRFLRKVIPLTMLAANVFSSISKKKKQIANVITLWRSFSYLSLNILKGITTQKDHTGRLICLRQMKRSICRHFCKKCI